MSTSRRAVPGVGSVILATMLRASALRRPLVRVVRFGAPLDPSMATTAAQSASIDFARKPWEASEPAASAAAALVMADFVEEARTVLPEGKATQRPLEKSAVIASRPLALTLVKPGAFFTAADMRAVSNLPLAREEASLRETRPSPYEKPSEKAMTVETSLRTSTPKDWDIIFTAVRMSGTSARRQSMACEAAGRDCALAMLIFAAMVEVGGIAGAAARCATMARKVAEATNDARLFMVKKSLVCKRMRKHSTKVV